jgi:hypothetical protein
MQNELLVLIDGRKRKLVMDILLGFVIAPEFFFLFLVAFPARCRTVTIVFFAEVLQRVLFFVRESLVL